MTDTQADNIKANSQAVVENFFEALEALDLDAALETVSEDCVYKNVPFHTANGKERMERDLRAMLSRVTGFEVEMLKIAAEGDTVLTERIDTICMGKTEVDIELMGVFVVHEGKITEWRDYFDWGSVGGRFMKRALFSVFSR